MKNVIIMGGGGRDFHNFNVVYRDDPDVDVVAFTATQIPGIDQRRYPRSLAGELYPAGIPVYPEDQLPELIRELRVDEVVFAYSDVSHETVMHKASIVLAAGADFRLLGPTATMLESTKPVIAVGAVRTGAGKSQTSRYIGQILLDRGIRVALVRHPMPYGDLEAMRVQRFATQVDIDMSEPTIEEREEYERPVELGMVMYAGVDYGEILEQAQEEADVVIWDGGNNDFPFFRPDLFVVVVDPLRAGHELRYHPGETNLRMADVVVVNKIDSAEPEQVARVLADIEALNPEAAVVRAESPVDIRGSAHVRRQDGSRRRRRVDDHARRDGLRGRHGRGPVRRRVGDHRPAAVGRRIDRRGLRAIPAHRARPARDGLRGRAAAGARGNDQRDSVRRRRHGDTDRPRAADRLAPSDPACDVLAA